METQITYLGNGQTNEFSFNFKVFKSDNIEVYINNLLQTGGYHVQFEDTGGLIIFNVPPSNQSKITIQRNLKLVRQTDFQECGIISSYDLNEDLDYLIELLKQTKEEIQNCIRKDKLSETDLTLPEPTAGHALIWDENAKRLINSKIDFLAESLIAQTACDESKEIFENIKTLLSYSSNGSALGLVMNMINAFKEKFPDVFIDCGDILDPFEEHDAPPL